MTWFFADDNEDILEDIDVPFLISVSHLMRMKVLVEVRPNGGGWRMRVIAKLASGFRFGMSCDGLGVLTLEKCLAVGCILKGARWCP